MVQVKDKETRARFEQKGRPEPVATMKAKSNSVKNERMAASDRKVQPNEEASKWPKVHEVRDQKKGNLQGDIKIMDNVNRRYLTNKTSK